MNQPTWATQRMIDTTGAGTILAILAAGWFAVGSPILRAERMRAATAADVERLGAELRAFEHEARELEASREMILRDAREASAWFRPVGTLNTRLGEIVASAQASGLSPRALSPGEAQRIAEKVRVPIELSAFGTYARATAFLEQIRDGFPDVAVGEIRMAIESAGVPDAEADRPIVRVDMTLLWYAVPDPAANRTDGARRRSESSTAGVTDGTDGAIEP